MLKGIDGANYRFDISNTARLIHSILCRLAIKVIDMKIDLSGILQGKMKK